MLSAPLFSHRRKASRVGDHVVVFASARSFLENLDGLLDRVAILHHLAQQLRHRLPIPMAFAAPAHLADGKMLFIHRRHAADKARVAAVHPRVPLVRLRHDDDRVLFEPHAFQIIEDAPVIHLPVRRGAAVDGKAGAVEEFRENIRDSDFLRMQSRGLRHRVHLARVSLADEGREPLLRLFDLAEKPAALFKRTADTHAVEHAVHEMMHFLFHQRAVLFADLLRRAFEKKNARAIALFETARAFDGDHLSHAIRRAERGDFVG